MIAAPIDRPVAFGDRFFLTRLLAVGGMAEIYLARQPSLEGFDKEVVIKRLKPALVSDRRVADMFLDEARIGALLNHPHIVHVYDFGEHQGNPYIAMEYILGEELNVLCRRGLEAGNFLPLHHSVELISQAAVGMGYFHARKDSEGGPLGIVHCDISPTNLLVTEDGTLKIIDFGIARSRGQRYPGEHAVPGKLSYMSPEQARRESLDHRSDIFSLGVVLYEITLGRRLFKGPAHEVYERLVACDVRPPTFVRRDYPGALEAVVMRALEADPRDRYDSAYDLAEALEDYLRDAALRSGQVRVARYLDELAVAGGGDRRDELIGESERMSDDDEGLDFDQGMFEGYRAEGQAAPALAEWEEFEESEQAVADALGIDVSLIRTAARAPSSPVAAAPEPARLEAAAGPSGAALPGDPLAADRAPARAAPGQPATSPLLLLAAGFVLGLGGAVILYLALQ
jgi:tRNA A-37 threonylcarbamoyl transferase component Bud32